MNLETYNKICAYLHDVIKGSYWEGNVYTVGGCCRDAIMGLDIHDVDLAVTVPDGGVRFALWLQEKGLTYGAPILYRRFSTSKLKLKAFPEHEIEVVQTRCEQYTDANSRNPEICFGTLKEDCDRRDLTINSLYYDVTTGELLDLTGRGVSDIKSCKIRTPMDPEDTFSDDPIRILRAIRFALRYGWKIPPRMLEAMKKNAHRIKIVRYQRISHEFEKALMGPHPEKLMQLLKETGIMFRILPEMAHLYKVKDHTVKNSAAPGEKQKPLPTLWELTLKKLADTPPVLAERFAALFSEFNRVKIPYIVKETKGGREKSSRNRRGRGRSAVVSTALRRLHYEPDFVREVKALLPATPVEAPAKIQKKKSKKSSSSRKKNVQAESKSTT